MSRNSSTGDFDDAYFDDEIDEPVQSKSSRNIQKLYSIISIILTLVLGTTLASQINISTGNYQEFGQGISLTVSCDKSIGLIPISSFVQDQNSSSHRLTSVRLSGIDTTQNTGANDEGCRGKTFKISAYSESETSIVAWFKLSINSDGTIHSGDGNTIASGENSVATEVIISFEDSIFTSTNIYRFTIESKSESFITTQLLNPIPGETIAALSATSGDVLYLVTADTDGNGNCLTCKLYRSIDFGDTWNYRATLPDLLWHIVGSADGTKLVGANWGGNIFTSSDSGATWIDRGNSEAWWHFSSSNSAQLVAGVTEKIGFKISRDYGVTWSSPLPPPPFGTYVQSAISPDGSKILVSGPNSLSYSDDGGNTWVERVIERNWSAVAMSSDGSHLYATENKDVGMTTGRIYISTDYGLTWKGSSISNSWWGIKTTPNGKTVVAFASDKIDTVFISNDYGQTWQRSASPLYVDNFAISSSGDDILILGGPILWGNLNLYRMRNERINRD